MAVVKILTETEVAERRQTLGLTKLAEDLHNVAGHLKNEMKFEAALTAMMRALALCPKSPLVHNGMAAILWNLQRFDEALEFAKTVMRMEPEDPAGWGNAGLIYSSMGNMQAAITHHRRAAELDPRNLHMRWSLATTLLRAGKWAEGFKNYECRMEYRGQPHYINHPYKTWQGEDLDGKTIMILSEQGSGDRILFSRYLHWLKSKWPTCRILMIETECDTLFWEFRHIVEYLPHQVPWPEGVDYAAWLMSLPMHHGTTPDNVYPDPGLIAARVGDEIPTLPDALTEGALKIGIVWRGNPAMAQTMWRNIPLDLMATLERDPAVQLYSLQQDSREVEMLGYSQTVCDLAPAIRPRGYVGTAVAMRGLDLVVTACTSTAHLAGALGIPCWVLLCSDPYWLWLRDGNTTPWYPSVRLFRQKKAGDWSSVIEEVRHALGELASERRDLRKTA